MYTYIYHIDTCISTHLPVYVYTYLLTYIFRVLRVPYWRITRITKWKMPWKLGFMQVDAGFQDGVPFRLALKLKVKL